MIYGLSHLEVNLRHLNIFEYALVLLILITITKCSSSYTFVVGFTDLLLITISSLRYVYSPQGPLHIYALIRI